MLIFFILHCIYVKIGKEARRNQSENKPEPKRHPENVPKKVRQQTEIISMNILFCQLGHENQAEPAPVSVAVAKAEDDR